MNYYNEIKNLIETKEINTRVRNIEENNETLRTYFEIGRLLYKAQGGEKRAKYGDKLIKKWAVSLSNEYGKGYDYSNLKRMRKLYLTFQKGGTLSHQLTWSHYQKLLSIKNPNEMNYYINLSINQNLSVRKLRNAIKDKAFERSTIKDKNNIQLMNNENNYKPTLSDMLKDPIIINTDNKDKLSEKSLKKYILKQLEHLFLELGYGFAYIGSEYKINIDTKHYYIDLLLFNTKLNAYVVIELKTRNFIPKDIGQIEFYMNYIDNNIKENFHNKTEGIIICKEHNKLVCKYISNSNIKIINYLLKEKKTISI